MVVYALFTLVTAWLSGCCGAATAPNHERGPHCVSLAWGEETKYNTLSVRKLIISEDLMFIS